MQGDPGSIRGVAGNLRASDIRFAQVLGELMDQRYKRNRAALASAAHVSASALSQYVHGRATPTLAVLVDLAQALEVSLDYLVYGLSPVEDVEYAVWAQHLEDTVRRMTSEATSTRQLVDRIGLELADRMFDVASEVSKRSAARGATLTAAEMAQLELFSLKTQIATPSLDTDVLLPRESSPDSAAAPGPFSEVVARNILEGRSYEWLIPDLPEQVRRARLIQQEIREKLATTLNRKVARDIETAMHGHLNFYAANHGMVPGYIMYTIDHRLLSHERPLLFDLVSASLGTAEESSNEITETARTIALIQPPTPGYDVYHLIPVANLPIVQRGFKAVRAESARLAFNDAATDKEN